jgi:hypothetical protein
MQSVPITTKVEISNPAQGEVYLIQHYVATNKIDRQDITEILIRKKVFHKETSNSLSKVKLVSEDDNYWHKMFKAYLINKTYPRIIS